MAVGHAIEDTLSDRVLPIGLFVVAILVGLSRFGGLLNIAFPPAAALVAIYLYARRPLAYLSFTMWVWMLTPFIRRLSDYQGIYHAVSILLIAPLAVTAITFISPMRYRRGIDGRVLFPFVVVLLALAYGFFVGALNGGLLSAGLGLANWSLPIVFAVHVLVLPQSGIDKARALLRALAFGGIVIGIYGIVQFVLLPPWDAFWMEQSELASIGLSVPFKVRVFSMLNTPAPFAQFAAAASLVAFTTRSPIRWPSTVLGVIGVLLSLVRATWGSWVICLMLLFRWAPRRQKPAYLGAALLASVIVAPIIALTPLGANISDRFYALSNASNDTSYLDRRALYYNFTKTALTSLVGVGLGQTTVIAGRVGNEQGASEVTTIDSGILDTFYSLGILAAVIFLAATAMVTVRAWPSATDAFATSTFIVAFLNIPFFAFGNSFVAPIGMLFFPFLAAAIASKTESGNGLDETA